MFRYRETTGILIKEPGQPEGSPLLSHSSPHHRPPYRPPPTDTPATKCKRAAHMCRTLSSQLAIAVEGNAFI